MFTHLQIQTGYSLLSSTISIDKLIAKAKQLDYKALAITDHNVMYGVIPFYQACKREGMKPLIGLTVDVKSEFSDDVSYPLVLLAKNNTGYHHLLKISSVIQTKAKDGIPVKWLKGYSAGLFAFTPGAEGEIESLLQKDPSKAEEVARFFNELFELGHFFLSLQRHGQQEEELVNEGMKALSEKLSIPLIVTHQVAYIEKDDAFALQCLEAIRDGEQLTDRMIDDHQRAYFTSQQEMAEWFADIPEALQRTSEIAAACEVELSFGRPLLPHFPYTGGKPAGVFLQELCLKGLEEAGLVHQSEYRERLLYELNIIERMGFSDYFLIVWDFMKFARERQILTGPGRGSAAGSLVAYVLHITTVDPLEYGLLFERFLNPERVSMPDIDLDFPDHRRDEVIQYISEKYGSLHAAQIITFGTLSAKAVMRDVARTFGFSTKELEQLSKMIPTRLGIKLQQVYEESEKFRAWIEASSNHEKLYKTALTLEGLPRHTSTHAAGMVITEQPLTDLIAIQEGHEQTFLTQFPMDILEQLGLLKIDLLGLRNLTILERILESIYYSEGKKLNLKNIPLQDNKTFQLLGEGRTTGIFQLESEGMRKVLTRLQPSHFEDIVAVNALYRPGPMENIPAYIDRKHGRKPVEYPHSDIKEILEPTYGVLIYQEQIIQIASKFAGFSLGEADLLRRAVSKKKRDVLDAERKHFVQGACQKGYSEETADKVYHLIVQFANYGFNRSHAVAYSFIAYQLAYLKAHYPLNFMAALLTSAIGNEEKIKQYMSEAKTIGVQVLPPSINESHFPFKAEKDGIRYSLAAIRGIGASVLKAILSAREKGPFTDLFDFCLRVPLKIVNRKAIESLILSGALDEFGQERAVLLASIDVAIDHVEFVGPEDEGIGLFNDTDFFPKPKYVETEPMSIQEKLTFEKEVLGVYVSAHPTKPYQLIFTAFGSVPVARLLPGNRQVAVGIFMNEVRVIRTKKGENMAFVQLSDESGEIEGVIFPAIYRQVATLVQDGMIFLLKGDVEERNGRKQLVVKHVQTAEELQLLQEERNKVLYVKIPHTPDEHLILEDVHHVVQRFQGQTPVVLHYERTHQTVRLREKSWIKPSEQLMVELEKIVGKDHVVLK